MANSFSRGLILLALIQRAETAKQAWLLASTVPMYVLAALISVMGVDFLIGRPRTMRHDRATAGAFATQMAGTAFVAGIVITAFYAAGGTLQLFKTIAYACGAVLLGLFFIVLFLRWFLRWVLRRFYDNDPYDPSS